MTIEFLDRGIEEEGDLAFIRRLKIKCNDWLLADMCPQAAHIRKQPNIALYFQSETVLKFYSLMAWYDSDKADMKMCSLGCIDPLNREAWSLGDRHSSHLLPTQVPGTPTK